MVMTSGTDIVATLNAFDKKFVVPETLREGDKLSYRGVIKKPMSKYHR